MQVKLKQNAAAGSSEGLPPPIEAMHVALLLGHPTAFVLTVHLFRQLHLSFVDFDTE